MTDQNENKMGMMFTGFDIRRALVPEASGLVDIPPGHIFYELLKPYWSGIPQCFTVSIAGYKMFGRSPATGEPVPNNPEVAERENVTFACGLAQVAMLVATLEHSIEDMGLTVAYDAVYDRVRAEMKDIKPEDVIDLRPWQEAGDGDS